VELYDTVRHPRLWSVKVPNRDRELRLEMEFNQNGVSQLFPFIGMQRFVLMVSDQNHPDSNTKYKSLQSYLICPSNSIQEDAHDSMLLKEFEKEILRIKQPDAIEIQADQGNLSFLICRNERSSKRF
jgi:hypothetical protein